MSASLIAWAIVWGGCSIAFVIGAVTPFVMKADVEFRWMALATGAVGFLPALGGFVYCAARLAGMPS